MAWKYNNRVIKAGKAWSDDDGIQHPSNWMIWDDAEKISRGLVWEDDAATVDQRFYWDTDIPRNLEDTVNIDSETSVTITDDLGNPVYSFGLKTQYKNQTNETANSLLRPTDWMIIANAERSRVIPTSITNYRAAVVSCCDVIKTNINACTSIGEFINLFESPTSGTGENIVVEGQPPIHAWPDKREF